MGTRFRRTRLFGAEDASYLRGQVAPRAGELLRDPALWVSVVIGFILVAVVTQTAIAQMTISQLATAGLTYASISFGATVTGCVMALSLSSDAMRTVWATDGPEGGRFTYFSELVFVFTWVAFSQLAVVIVSLLAFLFGGDQRVYPDHSANWHLISLWSACFILTYAVIHLGVLVTTLSQVGSAMIGTLNRDPQR